MSKEILERFNLISGKNYTSVDLSKIPSGQRARFISWLRENNLSLNESDNNSVGQSLTKHPVNSAPEDILKLKTQIGIDLQKTSELFPEVAVDLKSDPEFLGIFSPAEMAFAETRESPIVTLAGIFAAKEAIIKAGYKGSGIDNFSQIEICHDENGKPEFMGFSLSISHSGEYAIAIAVKDSIPFPDNKKKIESLINERVNINSNPVQRSGLKLFDKVKDIILMFGISIFVVYFYNLIFNL